MDKYLIEEILYQVLGQPHTTINDITQTTEAIVDYMLKKDERTYDRFIYYLMKSKLVQSRNINIETLREKVKNELEEIKNVINTTTTKS